MSADLRAAGLELRSLIRADGVLELSLIEGPVRPPGDGEVVVRMEAAPVNPGDLGILLGPADLSTLSARDGVTIATIPPALMPGVAGRIGQSMPTGVEGAGVVVAAGSDPAARALVGRTVSVFGGGMYVQHRTLPAAMVLPLPPGTDPTDGAAAFANPMTALGMVETLRMEGHTALVHTAAASNLGQMLVRVCRTDGVGLVNIVRSPEQAKMLRDLGAGHVADTSAPSFMTDLVAAVTATDATLAFDAVGGGPLASQILSAMEQAQAAKGGAYSRYGSSTHKQVYLYGGLDPGPTELARSYGMAWGVGGWILTGFIGKAGMPRVQELRARIAAEITTTFRSTYAAEVSLREMLDPDTIRAFSRKSTGGKFLVRPSRT
ncbi:MAG: zinc-binding dehydrogenase [Phenylobacterium sp.]|uniref:zinc-binding dehydrogenase n=1 Tax=Phenylobacterium sp. TaxID=1871053 RepID=UPI001A53C9EB|nr:zinc-binding dehydrogenase [Phenylobacterium sp.]MBL8553232.1 zinc-binding dehydrogenase [Phenylobacterium sp.]